MREITSLKATEEPILMGPRRQDVAVVRTTEARGIEVRGSIYRIALRGILFYL